MTEAKQDLINELQHELVDRQNRLVAAVASRDKETETYHRDRISALETALNALKK